MKRAFVITLVLAAILMVAAVFLASGGLLFSAKDKPNIQKGSGNLASENRQVSGFNEVLFSGVGEAILQSGSKDSLVIEADDNLLQYLTSEVVQGKLTIGLKPGVTISTFKSIRYTLTYKDLYKIEASGSCNLSTGSLAGENLVLANSGSGKFSVAAVQATNLAAYLSGPGSMEVKNGRVNSISVSLSSTGNFSAPEVEAQDGRVNSTGNGNAILWIKTSLEGTMYGSGEISYYGSPTLNVTTFGAGAARSLGNK